MPVCAGCCDKPGKTLDDAGKAERLLRNLAWRLEGLDEILTVTRLGLPPELRRSLACTNMIESIYSVVCQVSRNVKRWRNARMALRWTGAGMLEAKKDWQRLKAHRQLPILKASQAAHRASSRTALDLTTTGKGGLMITRQRRSCLFQHRTGHPHIPTLPGALAQPDIYFGIDKWYFRE